MMNNFKQLYYNKQWFAFAERVKSRDQFKCTNCKRVQSKTILQVHHKLYIPDLKPWEYSLSDCVTLCKGCHAREHGLIEPAKDWTLISIVDLGNLYGICEKKGCGTEIRYEHEIYHPKAGTIIVGSSCVEYLTEKDKVLSSELLKQYKNISKFVHDSCWEFKASKKGTKFIESKYNHHLIRIYGEEKRYSFQIAIKEKGSNWYQFKDFIKIYDKTINQVKELSYITLKGTVTKDEYEKEILRSIYLSIK